MSSPDPSRPPGKPNSQLPRYKTVAALTDQGKDFTPLAREENKPPGRRTKQPPVPKRIATPKARTPHGAPPAAFPVEPSPPLERTSTSPTLEHYHLPSGPAEIKRRQSFAAPRTSPPPVLAPIQSPTQSVTSPTTTAGHEGKNAEGYVNNGYTGTDKLSSEAGGAYIEDGLVAKKGVSGVKTREDTTTKGHGHSSSATHAHTEQAAKVKKETNDVTLDSLPPIKTEESVIPIATTEEGPTSSIPTVKKVAALKRDNSRASSTEMSSPTRSTSITKGTASAPSGAGTKRKAPTSGRKIEKKGIAKPSTAKKRKLDDDAASSARRTGSPASSRASKTPAPKTTTKVTQAASVASSPPAEDEDEKMEDDESIDENEVFCICRKPDDHSYMIACDGGCDDWFHGKCVGVLEKHGDLIDKYICKSPHVHPTFTLPSLILLIPILQTNPNRVP
jgi:COMPASS component SPP1